MPAFKPDENLPEASATPGVIVLRPLRQSIPRICDLIARVADFLQEQTPEGTLWIVDERRVRIRGEAGH